MNAIVQTLNTAGRGFVGSAVPMLIQSSLLILILLVVNSILRTRVRAVFRYWIWILVLVKLVLPPSLWSPVSLGTWLGDKLEAPTAVLLEAPEHVSRASSPRFEGGTPSTQQGQDALATGPSPVVTSFLSQPQRLFVEPPRSEPMAAPPSPLPAEAAERAAPIDLPPAVSLNWQGLVLLVWLAVVATLLLLLAQRTFFVRGLVAQAQEAGGAMLRELDECRRRLSVRRPISLRLSANAVSPAVCGLLRPVILVPQNLASRLHGTDLQAVLFHELAHVQRGDLWINLVQTLLQILYFYNPLLWLANAMIRRIREKAVDETVLVAMGEAAPRYPDTLINVAKLALARRPALSLRLIGVVESQSALTSRIKHILNRPLPKTARLGLLGLVIVSMSAAVLLPMAQAAQESVSVTSDGPLDIRLVGIRPDEGDELYDAEGRKLETPLGCFGTGSPVWNEDEQRRDFIFRVPAVQGQLLFPQAPPLRAAGTNYRQGGGFNSVFDPAEGPSTLVVSCTFPRTYRWSWAKLLHRESPIRKVDLTLPYFYGARREALCTFTGPFVEGKALAADEGRPYLLTPQKPPDGGSNSHIRFAFTTSQPFDSSVPVLLYDREGRRHLASSPGGSSGTGGTHLTYNVQTDWWDQITAITVGEKPQEITFRNLIVEYPNRPQRTYAAHLDRMAERLGLTGLSGEQLAQYRFKNAQEALAVLDVLRDGGQIQNATDTIFPNHLPVDFAALDAATRDRIRTAALNWLQSPSVALRACGVELGLRAGYREFVDPAFAVLDYRHPTAAANNDLYRVAAGLRQYRDSLTPADIERLRQLALSCDSGRVWSMVFEYCLREWRRPEVSEVLWELAQEERPWLWWAALKGLFVQGDERLKMYAALPEKMKLRVILTNRREQPGQAELLPKARRLLSGLFTPQTVLMHPQTGSDLRLALTTFLDRRETTAVYMDFLAAVLQPATRLEAEHSFSGNVNSIVSDLIRDLNAWYGVNLAGLGTYQPGKTNASIRSASELVKAVTAALDWYRTAETPQPVEPVLAGRVVDAKGRSIEGATVTLTEWWDSVDESGRQQRQRVPLGTIRTEADGRFVFRNLAAGRSHDLDVEAEGFTKRESMRVDRLPYRRYLVDRSEENNKIVLERSTSLSGRVIGRDGRPAAYVIVQVQSYPAHAEPQPNATTTDAQGRFTIGPLLSGVHVVRCLEGDEIYVQRGRERVKTFQVVHVEEGEAIENVTLDLREATAGLEAQVVDAAGQPAPLSYVSLDIALPSGEEEYAPVMFLPVSHTEPQSLYRFSNLPPLDGYLQVAATGQAARRIPIQLVAGQTTRCKVDLSRPDSRAPVSDATRQAATKSGPASSADSTEEQRPPGPLGTIASDDSRDTDGDGLSDFDEIHKYLTDSAKKDSDGDGVPDGDWNERREYAYSVRTVLRYMLPFDEKGLNDDFQDGRVLKRTDEYVEVEFIHYPFATGQESIPENRNWGQDDARMTEYLAPGPSTNWDEGMRRDLLAALKADGIDIDTLSDKQVVERVSRWLLDRSRYLDQAFTTWFVHFPQGKAAVYPGLEEAFRRDFERDSRNYNWTLDQHLDHEVLGKGMFYNKTHGSCTSTAVYLTTVLRALGIPTRMILVAPAVDASDPEQMPLVRKAITHNRVRMTMLPGLNRASRGTTNHIFNEVYLGNRWCRLDYTQLGCPNFGLHRFGLQTHLYTFNDLSDANLAPTWGRRYAKGERNDVFRHDNPYTAVEVSELFGPHGRIPNPPCTAQELDPHPQPDVFLFYPARADNVWDGFVETVKGGTANKTSRYQQKESYENLFDGTWLVRPQDLVILLFSLDTPERVPEGYEDLLPKPWPDIEAQLEQGQTVELSGKARERNVIVLAAPTAEGLKPLVQNSKLLQAIGGSSPRPSPNPSAGTTQTRVLPQSAAEPVRLANDVTIELLGVCRHPSTGQQWWRPDGTPLDKAPYRTAGSRVQHEEGYEEYEFAVRMSGPSDTALMWKIPGGNSSSGTNQPVAETGERLPDIYMKAANQRAGTEVAEVSVGVASGPWQTVARQEALDHEGSYTLEGGRAIAFGVPYEKDGHTYLPAATNFQSDQVDSRIVAVDEEGGIHEGSSSNYSSDLLRSSTCRFRLPLQRIKAFHFRLRPWTRVTYKGVSLRPGRSTHVTVEGQEAKTMPAHSRRPPGQEKVVGIGPVCEVFEEVLGKRYGGSIGGFSTDPTRTKQYFDKLLSWVAPGDVLVLMLAFDQQVGMPPEYADFLPWSEIESRVRQGQTVEAQGQARDLAVIILAAPTSGELESLLRQTHLLDPYRPEAGKAAAGPSAEQEKEIVLPETDRQQVVLDLATGGLVPLPPVGPEPKKLEQALSKLGKGDLLYDCDQGDRTLILMRGATSEQAQGDTGEPSWKGYLINPSLPAVLTVKTAEGRQYKITICATDDKACTLKYSPVLIDRGAGGGALAEPEKAAGPLAPRITPAGEGSLLSGVVVDEAGRALEDVRMSNWYPHGSMPQETKTDAQGRFSFAERRGYVVKAERDGLAPEFCEFKDQYVGPWKDQSLRVALTMTEGGVVAGTIRSRDGGSPVPGAQVWIELEAKDTDVGQNKYVLWRGDPQRTDGTGRFEFRHVPDGTLRVAADANGFAEGATESFPLADKSTRQIDLTLRPKTAQELQQDRLLEEARRDLSLSGTVTDEAGRPVAEVEVSNYAPHGSNPQRTRTDADGHYRFAAYEGYVVVAKKDGFAPTFNEFKDEYFAKYYLRGNGRTGPDRRGPITINLTLTRGATLTGVVRSGSEGAPAAGVRVHLGRQAKDTDVGRNEYAIWQSGTRETDGRGRFVFEHVPAGTIHIFANGVRQDPLLIEGNADKQIELRLDAGGGTLVEPGKSDNKPNEDRLKRLVDAAQSGAVVMVPRGRYTMPVEITKPVTLRGESAEGCIVEVTADEPALLVNTQGQGQVIVENLTIRWQLAGKAKAELPAALLVKGSNALIRNCRFAPLGDFKRSPMAVYIERPSKSAVDNCRFSGFDYVVCYGQGTEGTVQDCLIADCGHQGVINYDGATLTVQRNIITGSKFHAVRCTGGVLTVKDNLLIKNANRGIYLGNQTGRGAITNNLIVGNGTGISGFGGADYVIANNVVMDNSFAGIDMRDSCRFSIRNNLLVKNQRGLALFKEGTQNTNVVAANLFWSNATDVQDLEKPANSLTADPQFADPNHGDFTVRGPARDQGHGLTNPQVLKDLWKRYEQLRGPSAGANQPETPVRAAADPPAQPATPTPSSNAPAATLQELSGRVVDPDGRPAAGAQVALCTKDKGATVRAGRLAPSEREDEYSEIVETDGQGRFSFAPVPDEFHLLAAHDQGFASVAGKEFSGSGVLRLEPWGRIEGTLKIGRVAGANKQVNLLYYPFDDEPDREVRFHYEAQTDTEGRFAFARVPPTRMAIRYVIQAGEFVLGDTGEKPIRVQAGQSVKVILGGEGRPVVGEFVPPAGYQGPVYFSAGSHNLYPRHPEPPKPVNYDQMTIRQQHEWWEKWRRTPEAQAFQAMLYGSSQRRYTFRIKDDGSFRIEDVISGKYDFDVFLEEPDTGQRIPLHVATYFGTMEVPAILGGRTDEPLDLGKLALRMREPPLQVGDMAPRFEARTLDGKDLRLIDYGGKFVLLYFWLPQGYLDRDGLKDLHETYGGTGRLQIIGLGGLSSLAEIRERVAENKIEWPEIYFGRDSDKGIADRYRVHSLPYGVLVDPEGRIVAADVADAELTKRVRDVLASVPASVPARNDAADARLAWQRTDRYVPPDPNGFFPDDPEGGKKLDVLFQAVDKDQRSDEEILSTVRQGFRRTTQDRALVLRWIGNRYIWNQDPQNDRAVEIMYHAVPLERSDAVYFGLSMVRDKPANVLRTLADVCLQSSDEVGRITWGLGSQREALLPYLTPYLQDPDGAKRELAGVLVKHFKGELDFDQWRRQKGLEQVKAQFAGQALQFRQTLLTGDSEARYRALNGLLPLMRAAGGSMFLDDSLLPVLQVASTDPDSRVRNEVARTVGGRWVWGAPKRDPNAIALMLKLSTDSDREVRYNAVYYGLSVVRDKSEPIIRRLVEMALADHENNLYGRIVWGLRGFPRDTSGTFDKVLAEQLARAKTDVRRAAAIYVLYRDVREKEPPTDWDLASVRQRYPDDLFVLPVSAREPFQPKDAAALWSEFVRALPAGTAAERLSSWYTNEEHACYARIRGKEQAETIRNAIGSHPRLRAGEIHPLTLTAQLYLEE